jgi:hypothetical protein
MEGLMRALLICLIITACDNSVTSVNDLAVPGDLSKPDLVVQLSCKDAQACIEACTTANLNACVPACIGRLSTAAHMYFDPLEACSGPACTNGGSAPCVDPGSQACTNCVMQNCAAQEAACLAH